MLPSDQPPQLGRLTEALSGHGDVAALTRILTGSLADALPPGMVQVDFERSMIDRLHNRAGRPVGITINVGERELSLTQSGKGRPEAVIARTVRGVVISRNMVSVTDWIAALAQELTRVGEQDEAAREALTRLLLG
jgi:hypothetical protein